MLFTRSVRCWAAMFGAASAPWMGAAPLSVSIGWNEHGSATTLAEPEPRTGRLGRYIAASRSDRVRSGETLQVGPAARAPEATRRARLRHLPQRTPLDVPVAELRLAYDDWATPLASLPGDLAQRSVEGDTAPPSPEPHSFGVHHARQSDGRTNPARTPDGVWL